MSTEYTSAMKANPMFIAYRNLGSKRDEAPATTDADQDFEAVEKGERDIKTEE